MHEAHITQYSAADGFAHMCWTRENWSGAKKIFFLMHFLRFSFISHARAEISSSLSRDTIHLHSKVTDGHERMVTNVELYYGIVWASRAQSGCRFLIANIKH